MKNFKIIISYGFFRKKVLTADNIVWHTDKDLIEITDSNGDIQMFNYKKAKSIKLKGFIEFKKNQIEQETGVKL